MITKIGSLKYSDPVKWTSEIYSALQASNGFLDDAADRLGVSKRQLIRWIKEQPSYVQALVAPPHQTKKSTKKKMRPT